MREMLNPGHGTISEERIDKKVIKHDSAPGVQAYSTADGCGILNGWTSACVGNSR